MPTTPLHALRLGLAAAAGLSLFQGCQPVMPAAPTGYKPPVHSKYDNTVADWPFRFISHSFGVATYDTYGCKVIYDNFLHVDQPDDELQSSSASIGPDYRDHLGGGYIGVRNFPSPAIVTWRSKDGTPHRAEIDIGEIFKDQLILHDVAKENVPEEVSVGDPEIVLEVNDRTINVYMKAFIPTKELQIPGNKYSSSRNDLILAFSRTY